MSIVETGRRTLENLRKSAAEGDVEPRTSEIGRIVSAGDGIARVSGLPSARSLELIRFSHGITAMAFNIDEDDIGCILLGDDTDISAGDTAQCTGEVARTPVGSNLMGRVIDPLGNPLDGGAPIAAERYDPVEHEAPSILARSPVVKPLSTGLKSVDALIPIGRGQRQLIIGDRSTGKTTIAIDAIINQAETGVLCVYVSIGQRASSVARLIGAMRECGAMEHTVVVVADADSSPGLKYIAPYAGCTISEFFMNQGHDTLVVYDDLTKHAQTYRELSLLMRRPPGREAYPGDVFFIHSRLLERATQLDEKNGGGSQTALPIIETQAQNISAYVPTNLISITDGQVYLSPELYQAGFLPAVDIGLSVSRVGSKTQIPAMKSLAQQLRLTYTQFLELEQFTKFGTTLEDDTQTALDTGRRLRELLKQPAHDPVSLSQQVVMLKIAATDLLNQIEVDQIRAFEQRVHETAPEQLADLLSRIESGEELSETDSAAIDAFANSAKTRLKG